VQRLGLDAKFIPRQYDRRLWPELRTALAATLATKTRDEWCALLEGSDACFAPVLSLDEAPAHAHARARAAYVELDGVVQPAAAPRFSRSVPEPPRPAPQTGQHTRELLAEAGFGAADIDALLASGAAR
jgi:alpha-methylacyl-CoA racemase